MQLLAGVGQHHAASAAHEQRGVVFLLDRPDLPAQRRLGYAQRLRGAAEIAVFDHREEISDLVQLHWSVPVALYSIIEYLLSEKFD